MEHAGIKHVEFGACQVHLIGGKGGPGSLHCRPTPLFCIHHHHATPNNMPTRIRFYTLPTTSMHHHALAMHSPCTSLRCSSPGPNSFKNPLEILIFLKDSFRIRPPLPPRPLQKKNTLPLPSFWASFLEERTLRRTKTERKKIA